MINIDGERLIKNPISLNSELSQILHQLTETMSEIHRKSMKTCKQKAADTDIKHMIEQFNIQHLLAINRVDFSHFTTISIENQSDSPDSLSQFKKVMINDTQ